MQMTAERIKHTTVRIITGDCRDVLKTLPSESVHCVVTSPPYWGLRDYVVAGQIGLESNYADFVEQMVSVFREVRRVLRSDGTLWLILGDSYSTSASGLCQVDNMRRSTLSGGKETGRRAHYDTSKIGRLGGGLKPKDLCGIPWRVAFALQADGWWLRQEIIWHKPNPIPESVTDRCTKSHESLFLFAKNGGCSLLWRHRDTRAWVGCQPPADYVWRHCKTGAETREPQTGEGWSRINLWAGFDYYFDAEAIAERAEGLTEHDVTGPGYSAPGQTPHTGTRRSGNKERKPAIARGVPIDTGGSTNGAVAGSVPWEGTTRNKRSVWTVVTAPFPDAHFATFPPALIEPCIAAGCPAGGTVLDSFGGAGTTGLVADRLGCNAILIELNPEYAAMAERRIRGDAGMFANIKTDAVE